MNRPNTWIWPFVAVLIAFSFLLPARSWADDDDNYNNDPPSRVARMSYSQGSVSFQPGGEGDWVEAVPNRPLTSGDNLWTDRDARAELHSGSTSIRLGSETSLTFLELDDRTLQLRLAQGTALVRVRHMDDDDLVEIDTPNLAFQITRNGEYRVDVRPDGQTTIIDVYQGRGEAIGGGNNYTVVAGQHASFTGDPDQGLNYDIDRIPSPDGFERWAFDRDRREDQSPSANYVSPEMTGYEDLDANGNWSYAGNYGPVWYPTAIPVGWAPYRYGHWVWVAPWGWTWVDDAPWGFAPFHYGRWCQIGGRWGWIPGPVAVRPVYAPALVAFVGGGGFNFSVSFGGGPGVAWFPLAPGEVFVPTYHVSRNYVNQVNVTNTVVNVTRVTNVYNYYTTNNTTVINRVTYVNQNAPNAVTAVSRETFVNARPVARNIVAIQPREIERAPVTHMPVAEPLRASVIGSGRPTRIAPPVAVANRQVVAQRIPPSPPTPFAQRQDKLIVRPVQQPNRPGNWRQPPQGERQEPPVTRQESSPYRPEPPVNREDPGMKRPQPAPAQPAPRPEWQAPRQPGEPAVVNQPRPEATRPEAAQPPRAEPARPEPARQPVEPTRPEAVRERPERSQEPTNNVRQQQPGWANPLTRPAPPVQPKSEQQAQRDEQKYRNWQQKQEQKPAPRPENQKPDKKDKKDDKDDKDNKDNKKHN